MKDELDSKQRLMFSTSRVDLKGDISHCSNESDGAYPFAMHRDTCQREWHIEHRLVSMRCKLFSMVPGTTKTS